MDKRKRKKGRPSVLHINIPQNTYRGSSEYHKRYYELKKRRRKK